MEIKYLNNVLRSAREKFMYLTKDKQIYRSLLEDTRLSNYFSRYYPFVEIKGMRKYLSRSKFFDKKFIDKISAEVTQSKELFINSLKDASTLYGVDFKIKVTTKDLRILTRLLELKLFPFFNRHKKPSFQEVINGLNLKASSGLPEPWFSKKQFILTIHKQLDSVLSGEFNLIDSLNNRSLYSSAFKRFQITSTKMKARLVYCLNFSINVCEKYFDCMFKMMFEHPDCPMVHGKTQLQISILLSKYKHLHALSFDVKGFDIKTPGEIICLAFEHMHYALGLDRGSYYSNLFFDIRDLLLCMPCYHPVLSPIARKRGISSGSGLTSSLGSFCMYIMHTLCLMKYCKLYNKNIFRCTYHVFVSSDDSVIFSGFKIDHNKYSEIFVQTFDLELDFEGYSPKNVDEVTFLGSTWREGLPVRNVNRMFGRIMFGSPNIPKMDSEYLLFCSRCYDILGNVSNFDEIFSTFGIEMSVRLFRFAELMDFSQQSKFREMNLIDRRGFWSSRDPSERLDNVWRTR